MFKVFGLYDVMIDRHFSNKLPLSQFSRTLYIHYDSAATRHQSCLKARVWDILGEAPPTPAVTP